MMTEHFTFSMDVDKSGEMVKRKVLVIGHGDHGKDTVAEMLRDLFGFTFQSSSAAAAKLFLFDDLKEKYGYKSFLECYEDRRAKRDEWAERITAYNTPDKARLARHIMSNNDIYVGMRCDLELAACRLETMFDLVIGVFDPRKPFEPSSSFKIDLMSNSDIILPNAGSLEDLLQKVMKLKPLLFAKSSL